MFAIYIGRQKYVIRYINYDRCIVLFVYKCQIVVVSASGLPDLGKNPGIVDLLRGPEKIQIHYYVYRKIRCTYMIESKAKMSSSLNFTNHVSAQWLD